MNTERQSRMSQGMATAGNATRSFLNNEYNIGGEQGFTFNGLTVILVVLAGMYLFGGNVLGNIMSNQNVLQVIVVLGAIAAASNLIKRTNGSLTAALSVIFTYIVVLFVMRFLITTLAPDFINNTDVNGIQGIYQGVEDADLWDGSHMFDGLFPSSPDQTGAVDVLDVHTVAPTRELAPIHTDDVGGGAPSSPPPAISESDVAVELEVSPPFDQAGFDALMGDLNTAYDQKDMATFVNTAQEIVTNYPSHSYDAQVAIDDLNRQLALQETAMNVEYKHSGFFAPDGFDEAVLNGLRGGSFKVVSIEKKVQLCGSEFAKVEFVSPHWLQGMQINVPRCTIHREYDAKQKGDTFTVR